MFKKIVRIFSVLVVLLAIASVVLVATGNSHLFRAVAYTYLSGQKRPSIHDHTKFEHHEVVATQPQPWREHPKLGQNMLTADELKTVEQYEPAAILVIKDDQVLFEQYWEDYGPDSRSNSFSMAKSFTSMCIGAALDDGLLKSVDEPVANYLEEFKTEDKKGITIKNVLQMASGLDFDENYKGSGAFGFNSKAYYGYDLESLVQEYGVKEPPNTHWEYLGGNTVILACILNKVLEESLADYFARKFWQPMGAEHTATWLTDEEGFEKAFCCFNSNARDFARVAKLYLQQGKWNGKQLLSADYVADCLTPGMLPDVEGKIAAHYGYQWYTSDIEGVQARYCMGMLGQYIVAMPELNSILVRLGNARNEGPRVDRVPEDLRDVMRIAKRMIAEAE